MGKRWNKAFKLLILSIFLSVSGCASWHWNGTQVNRNHLLVRTADKNLYATVYFLRPPTERPMGFSDNALKISLDGTQLLTLEKGDYTMVHLHPRDHTTMTVEDRTEVGPYWKTKVMDKDYPFDFMPGKTYYIVFTLVDGEFRGIYYTAKNVDQFTAKQLAHNMRPAGDARKAPLTKSDSGWGF